MRRKRKSKSNMEKKNLKLNIKRSNLLHPITEFVIGGGITLISALFTMWLCQFSCGFILTEIMTLSAFVVCFCIYAVIFAFVTVINGRLWLGNSISMVFLFAVTVLDYQVYSFQGTEILPGDFGSIRTAIGVAGHYQPNITVHLIISLLLLAIYVVLLRVFLKCRKGFFWKGISVGGLIGAAIVFTLFIDNIPLIVSGNIGMKRNTFPINFCRLVYGSTLEKPEGYSVAS